MGGLVLLTAERAAQPGGVHLHHVHRKAQDTGGDPLHGGGGLGGGDQPDASVFGWRGVGVLGLHVEMLLAA